jgi:hypothetical protein
VYIEVNIGAPPSVEVNEPDDLSTFLVRVRGGCQLSDLRATLESAGVGIAFGHDAAIDVDWIQTKVRNRGTQKWQDRFQRWMAMLDQHGLADVDGRWIVGSIIWEEDDGPRELSLARQASTRGSAGAAQLIG